MQMRQIILVGAALLGTISTVLCAQPFTFYALVLQWPPSVCNSLPAGQTCIHDIPERFTVHGLWPQRSDASPVHRGDEECNECFFTATKLDKILKEKSFYANLQKYWPNLLDEAGGDSILWSIQWNGHGICSDLQSDPRAYFKCVTVLFNDPKFGKLRQVGQSYTLADIQQKLKGKYGVKPQIACNKKTQLWEIRFCYKRVEGREPVDLQDCPKLSDTKYPCDQNGIQLPNAPAPPPASTPRMVSAEVHSEL
ncbi:hypothetical protein F3Y22_tig00110267pilonHSYRG00038 [Hibiscus syriacus]|uniref:Uncharacterized protein n=1 Tax=Hibiscus syriacus TaxID=106335 RepID=A0A6A3BAN9_HIBSY|nr:hypothetical protein F3Y22_tig00110267pilonHSYRG00038 [Hibiscus syriacus]